MKAYIAGKFTARFRLRAMRDRMQELGYEVTAHWLDMDDGDYPVPRPRAMTESRRNLNEVAIADVLVIDTLDESVTGGREVELGIFLMAPPDWARQIVLVGPVRNIFHELADHRCRDWSDALEVLASLAPSTTR